MILRFTSALLAALAVATAPEASDPAEGAAPPAGPPAVERAPEEPTAALAHDGTYRVHGTARISARPLPMDATEVHADVVVRAGPEPGLLALRLASQGQTCLLAAHLGEGGALSISAGQRCQVRLAPPDGRGEVTGVLREGRGRLAGERLALDLAFEVEGTVSLPLPKELAMLGGASEAWTPDLPVRGEARAAAEGKRDASRAAEDADAAR